MDPTRQPSQPGGRSSGPGWYRPPSPRRRPIQRILIAALALFVALVVGAVGVLLVGLEGGPEAIWLNSLPAPDQDKPEMVQKRAAARSTAEASLVTLDHTSALTKGPRSYSAACERGQNNWKVHQGYRHTCDVSVAGFYGWTGGFPEMARRLHRELVVDGWSADDYYSLPSAAKEYETGVNRFSEPTDRFSNSKPSLIAIYDKGDRHVLLQFANVGTTDVSFFDYEQNRGRSGLSWSDTRETVDSAGTVRALLESRDGVLFALTSESYYSIGD